MAQSSIVSRFKNELTFGKLKAFRHMYAYLAHPNHRDKGDVVINKVLATCGEATVDIVDGVIVMVGALSGQNSVL